jgi:hypothetical protein
VKQFSPTEVAFRFILVNEEQSANPSKLTWIRFGKSIVLSDEQPLNEHIPMDLSDWRLIATKSIQS